MRRVFAANYHGPVEHAFSENEIQVMENDLWLESVRDELLRWKNTPTLSDAGLLEHLKSEAMLAERNAATELADRWERE